MSWRQLKGFFVVEDIYLFAWSTFHVIEKQLQTGWPDWVIFHQLGYFWKLIMIFWKDEVAQNNSDFLGYFLFKQIYYIFT